MAYQNIPRIQPQGFYNPFSASPNLGAGFSGMIRETIMLQKEKEQEKEEQERYEEEQTAKQEQRDITRRRQETYEKQVAGQLTPTEPKKSAFMEKYELFNEILKNPKQAAMIAQNFKEPVSEEERIQRISNDAKVRGYWNHFYKDADKIDDNDITKNLYKDIQSRIKALTSDKYSLEELFVYSQEHGGKYPPLGKNADKIANLLKLSDHVAGVGIKAVMGDLSTEELNGLFKIATNLSRFEATNMEEILGEEIGKEIKKKIQPPEAIDESKVPKGTPIQVYPDGKKYVQIGRKWYFLNRKK